MDKIKVEKTQIKKHSDTAANKTIENKGKNSSFAIKRPYHTYPKAISTNGNKKRSVKLSSSKCKLIRKNSTKVTNPFWACQDFPFEAS